MNVIRQLFAVVINEWQVFTKDKVHVFTVFLLPILIAGLLGSAYTAGDDLELPVALVNLDQSQYSADMVSILKDIDEIKLNNIASIDAANDLVVEGEAIAVIIIPANFGERIDAYEQTEVQVLMDPAQAEYGQLITSIMDEVIEIAVIQGEMKHGMNAVTADLNLNSAAEVRAAEAQNEGVVDSQTKRMIDNPPVAVVKETVEGAAVQAPDNVFVLLVPGFTVMFSFFLLPVIAGQLLREKEEGALRRLVAAPLSTNIIMAGKVIAYMVVVILQVFLIFMVAAIAFGMPLGNSPLGMVLITFCLALAATSLGVMLAALAHSEQQAGSIGLLLVFILAGVGGCIQLGSKPLPLFRYENFVGFVSRLTPHAQALEGYMRLIKDNGTAVDVLPQSGILLMMTVVFFVVAVWRFRFE